MVYPAQSPYQFYAAYAQPYAQQYGGWPSSQSSWTSYGGQPAASGYNWGGQHQAYNFINQISSPFSGAYGSIATPAAQNYFASNYYQNPYGGAQANYTNAYAQNPYASTQNPAYTSPYVQNPYASIAQPQGTDSVSYLTQLAQTQGIGAAVQAVHQHGPDFEQRMTSYLRGHPEIPISQALLSSLGGYQGGYQGGQQQGWGGQPSGGIDYFNNPNGAASGARAPWGGQGNGAGGSTTPWGGQGSGTGGIIGGIDTSQPIDATTFVNALNANHTQAIAAFKQLKKDDQKTTIDNLITQMASDTTTNDDGTLTFNDEGQAIYKFLFKESGFSKSSLKEMLQATITDPSPASSTTDTTSSSNSDSSSSTTSVDPTHLYYNRLLEGKLKFTDKNGTGGHADPQNLLYKDPAASSSGLANAPSDVQAAIVQSIAQKFIDAVVANNGADITDVGHKKEYAFLKALIGKEDLNKLLTSLLSASNNGGDVSKAQLYLSNLNSGGKSITVNDASWKAGDITTLNNLDLGSLTSGTSDADLNKLQISTAATNAIPELLATARSDTPTIPTDIDSKALLEAFAKQWYIDVKKDGNKLDAKKQAQYQALDAYFQTNSAYASIYAQVRSEIQSTDAQYGNVFAAYLAANSSTPSQTGSDAMSAFVSGTFATKILPAITFSTTSTGEGLITKDMAVQFYHNYKAQNPTVPTKTDKQIQDIFDGLPSVNGYTGKKAFYALLQKINDETDSPIAGAWGSAYSKEKMHKILNAAFGQEVSDEQFATDWTTAGGGSTCDGEKGGALLKSYLEAPKTLATS